jgi:hypothetical protein
MDDVDTVGKKKLVRTNTNSVDDIVVSDLTKQELFGRKLFAKDFINLYEIISKDNSSTECIDCRKGFIAGYDYQILKPKKIRQQLASKLHLGSFEKYSTTVQAIDNTKPYSGSISFELGQQKARMEQKEQIYALTFTVATLGGIFYSMFIRDG